MGRGLGVLKEVQGISLRADIKTEEATVTSKERVSRQKQSPGKDWPCRRLESWGTARRQGHLAQRKPEARREAKPARQPHRKTSRQKGSCYMPGLLLVGAVALQGNPLPQSCPLCEVTGHLLYPQAGGVGVGVGVEGKESR